MATEIVMVKVGMTMTEGTVSDWLVDDGQSVAAGDALYRLETEKVDMDVEAEAAGVVRHAVPAGTTVEVGALIGYILAEGEALPDQASPASGAAAQRAVASGGPTDAVAAPVVPTRAAGERIFASPIARRLAKERGLDLVSIPGTGPNGRVVEADIDAASTQPAVGVGAAAPAGVAQAPASPVARALANQLSVDLARVPGTGPGGRITKEDVEAFARANPAGTPVAPSASGEAPALREPTILPVKGMRKVIAQRMHASLQEMAQLTLGMDVTMDEAVRFRQLLLGEWEQDGIRVSITDMVMKAVAKALLIHPGVNISMDDDEITMHPAVHLGMAVAVDDGLLVPVIRDVDTRPLKEVAAASTRLAGLARDRKLSLDELSGSTFSVTALGAAGIDFFTPIINPPNVAILGIGRMREGVAWDGDRPVKRTFMTLSLTIDHRALDGAPAAAFLGTVRDIIESPYRLVL